MDKEKIEIVRLKDRYLYKLNIWSTELYLMNGKPLEKTFKDKWFVCDNEPKKLQKKETIKINEKWELKNKDLYNETIPLIVDEHTKGKYKSLVESDLYLYTYENKEILKDVELEIISSYEIDDDIPFEYRENIETRDGWCNTTKSQYLIERVEYSIKDNCLSPTPIKELTKPCILPKKYVYMILTDYIKRNINNNFAKIRGSYDFVFEVKTPDDRTTIIYWVNDYDKKYTFKDLYAKNFKELVKKVESMKKEVIEYINQKHICQCCGGSGLTHDKLDINKYFDNE